MIVIQEIFGLDEYVRADVGRWAKMGYEAVAPSMYDRREPGFLAKHDDAGSGVEPLRAIAPLTIVARATIAISADAPAPT